ncbi:MAG: cytochrome c [Methylocystis sp.]|uniref:c-type cytochrome n=1 Tax=Methylocystis sp. TaxID=1911079 RepID=UPI003D150103
MLRFATLAIASCLLFAAGAAAAKTPGEARLLKRGRAIAQENCGRCHAVGPRGESANPKSPPFRSLARKYPLSNLEEALAEGIVVGHEGLDMPQFRLNAAQIDALLAYLASIQK